MFANTIQDNARDDDQLFFKPNAPSSADIVDIAPQQQNMRWVKASKNEVNPATFEGSGNDLSQSPDPNRYVETNAARFTAILVLL